MEKKSISLAWSGGFDSTAYLLCALNDSTIEQIELISFCLDTNTHQSKAEFTARHNILEILRLKYLDKYEKLKFDWAEGNNISLIQKRCSGGLLQATLWCSLLPIVANNPECVIVNVIDDLNTWHFKHEMFKVFEYSCALMERKDLKLTFPFEWTSKEEMLDWYVLYPGIFEYIAVSIEGTDWKIDGNNGEKCEKTRELYKKYLLLLNPVKENPTEKTDTICDEILCDLERKAVDDIEEPIFVVTKKFKCNSVEESEINKYSEDLKECYNDEVSYDV